MSIKKRMFISNILMIVIPIVLAFITLLVAYGLFNIIYHGSLHEIAHEIEMEYENRFDEPTETARAQLLIVGMIYVSGLVALTYFTNHFLIRFVFRNIERPLDVLTQGVQQIKKGNLDYRIIYNVQDEFQSICGDFNEMAARLKYSVDETVKNELSRKELIAGISHDLRSPLTSIKAYVEGLIDGVAVTPDAQREYLETIKTKTDDISKMVSQLFLFSKMDTGNYPVNPELLDIAKEIADFVSVTRDDYKTKGLHITFDDTIKGTAIFADSTQLRSVFTNILDNSAKYKDKESVKVLIHCETSGESIFILFDDNGPGVPDGALPKLFDVFYRGDTSRNDPQQGSGLGLAIASKMIAFMKGSIHAENLSEGGLRVVMQIPVLRG